MNAQHISSVDLVYAQALLEMADEHDQLDATAEELAQLGELLESQSDLKQLVTSRVLGVEQRAGAIDHIFKGKVSDLLRRFLLVVNQKNRTAELPGIINAFAQLYAEKRGVVEADVYVANELDDAALSRIASQIGEALGRQVVPHQHVDASLIGGLKLRIGDRLIDGSVATQLRMMRDRMVRGGRETLRAGERNQ